MSDDDDIEAEGYTIEERSPRPTMMISVSCPMMTTVRRMNNNEFYTV